MSFTSSLRKMDGFLARLGAGLQSPLLLAVRLYWGWQFFLTGKGKLGALDRTAEFFASLSLPWPKLNALLAGGTECVGGLLLLAGLGTRWVTLPLIFTMVVAYVTTEREALAGLWSDSDAFVTAAPFLFLFASLILFVFGPGKFSLEATIGRKQRLRPGREVWADQFGAEGSELSRTHPVES